MAAAVTFLGQQNAVKFSL